MSDSNVLAIVLVIVVKVSYLDDLLANSAEEVLGLVLLEALHVPHVVVVFFLLTGAGQHIVAALAANGRADPVVTSDAAQFFLVNAALVAAVQHLVAVHAHETFLVPVELLQANLVLARSNLLRALVTDLRHKQDLRI